MSGVHAAAFFGGPAHGDTKILEGDAFEVSEHRFLLESGGHAVYKQDASLGSDEYIGYVYQGDTK